MPMNTQLTKPPMIRTGSIFEKLRFLKSNKSAFKEPAKTAMVTVHKMQIIARIIKVIN